MTDDGLTYKQAGVDIDAGNELVRRIGERVRRTRTPGVLAGLGGFGGLFKLDVGRFHDPVLVSGTDGVGTKLLLARELGRHDTIGIDLVAMCVNDIVVTGAEPLFFLDYFATGALDVDAAATVIDGIAAGCEEAGCALIGGETAEMPGLYGAGEYDLAGFAVGAVNRADIVDGGSIRDGDAVIGLRSSGPHSNGYSLIRHTLAVSGAALDEPLASTTLGDALIAPTRIYVKALMALLARVPVRGLAHITGGGLLENIPRVLPGGLGVELDAKAWTRPPVFDWLQHTGRIAEREMLRTFNCGIGMAIVVRETDADETIRILSAEGEDAMRIGHVSAAADGVRITA